MDRTRPAEKNLREADAPAIEDGDHPTRDRHDRRSHPFATASPKALQLGPAVPHAMGRQIEEPAHHAPAGL
ncbi:hypothetical protein [Paracoccus cavernae]|uniref:hypothetical protein n=1 Tax=Paracoccus cavernae TaxID=1571207 RepID=UPI0035F451E4